jgi:hypothetical protein
MASPPPEDKKRNLWDLAGTRIGVIAAAVGLLIALIGLPHTIRDALRHSDAGPSSSDLKTKKTEVDATAPRLKVRYLFLSTDLIHTYLGSKEQARQIAGTFVTAFPIVRNDVFGQIAPTFESRRGCRYQKDPNTSAAFLEISNAGKRDAANVVIDLDRLWLRKSVQVLEGTTVGGDYDAKLRAAAVKKKPVEVQLPGSLGPGQGVWVPLFISDAPAGASDRWCALSGAVYLPRRVSFDDQGLGTKTNSAVRRMLTPVNIARGAFERG